MKRHLQLVLHVDVARRSRCARTSLLGIIYKVSFTQCVGIFSAAVSFLGTGYLLLAYMEHL